MAPWLIDRTHFVVEGALNRTYDLVTGESCASNGDSVPTRASTRRRRSSKGESVTVIPVIFNPGSTTPERLPPPNIDEMEYLQKKLEMTLQNARDWREYQSNPLAVKLLDPLTVKSKKGNKQKLSDLTGSFKMYQILEKSNERDEAINTKAQETSAASKKTAAEKAAAKAILDLANNARTASKSAHLLGIWANCGDGCRCPKLYFHKKRLGQCPTKGLKCCDQCGDIKKSACKKQACVAAAAAAA
jgi:hypothetical protein